MDRAPLPDDATDDDAAFFERVGVYDPARLDAAERLSLLRRARALGASPEELRASSDLVELILDRALRPRTDVSLGEAVAETDLSWAEAERLLGGVGLPTDPEAPATAAEVEAVRVLAAATQLLGFEATVQLTRATGGAMARVAEALVTGFRLRVEQPRRDAGGGSEDIVREFSALADTVLPNFVRTIDAALRYQIVRAAQPMWSTDTERSAVVLPRTIGFVDLVGYTTAASSLSVKELIEVLTGFDEATSTAVAAEGGQIVKMIGDEAMFATADPVSACRIALRLSSLFGRGGLPPVRVGLAAGEVVSVFGDMYGPVVNLASRFVGAAEPSTVLVDENIVEACRSYFRFAWLAPLELKGIVEPVRVARLEGQEDGRFGHP